MSEFPNDPNANFDREAEDGSADSKPNPYAASRLDGSNKARAKGDGVPGTRLRKDRQIDPDIYVHEFLEDLPEPREFELEEVPAMRTVKSGLSYYFSGLYLMTFCFFVGSFARRVIGPQMAAFIMYGTTFGAFIVLIGELKCLAVPRKAGGFQQVLVSVFFYTACVVLHLIKHTMQARGNVAPGFFVQIGLLQLIAGFFANFFFLSFIVSLTRFLHHGPLHHKALKTRRDIWTMIGFVIVVFFTFVLLVNPRAGNAQPFAFIVLGLGTVAFLIMLYSWLHRFTKLVKETCDAIVVE